MARLMALVRQHYRRRGWRFDDESDQDRQWINLDGHWGVVTLLAFAKDERTVIFDAGTGVSVSPVEFARLQCLDPVLDLVGLGQDPADGELRAQRRAVMAPGVEPEVVIEFALDDLLPKTDLLRPVIAAMRNGHDPQQAFWELQRSQ